jgi:uncharacterized protein (TIGR00725 family)
MYSVGGAQQSALTVDFFQDWDAVLLQIPKVIGDEGDSRRRSEMKGMRKPIVGVMGPGRGATPADIEAAYELGKCIAQQGWLLLTGGRNEGVMHAANQGAKDAGGLTIGILPGSDPADLSSAVDIPILTGMGNARNSINVLSSDMVMVCGMGCGTASEVALALKVQKPVILLNGRDVSQTFFQQLTNSPVFVAIDPAQAVAIAHNVFNSTADLSHPLSNSASKSKLDLEER